MFVDVVQQRAFYTSRLGLMSCPLICQRLQGFWGDVTGLSVLGLGYAIPYLQQFAGQPERLVACMPAQQGVVHWPAHGNNLAGLCHETDLPLRGASFERILMVHLLEQTDHPEALMQEAWRVLVPQGRILLVVPNRRSIWTRFDHTPFGHGRPFSRGQLSRLLEQADFIPLRWDYALAWPPGKSRAMIHLLGSMEGVGLRLWRELSGVLIVEAEKRVYGRLDNGRKVKPGERIWRPVPAGQLAREVSTKSP